MKTKTTQLMRHDTSLPYLPRLPKTVVGEGRVPLGPYFSLQRGHETIEKLSRPGIERKEQANTRLTKVVCKRPPWLHARKRFG